MIAGHLPILQVVLPLLAAPLCVLLRRGTLCWGLALGVSWVSFGIAIALLARGKNPIDGAQPSGNSVSAQNLLFLGKALKRPEYVERGEQTINSISGLLAATPSLSPRMAIAVRMLHEQKPPMPSEPANPKADPPQETDDSTKAKSSEKGSPEKKPPEKKDDDSAPKS